MMSKNKQEISDDVITDTINYLTEKISRLLLDEFLKLDKTLQINLVLIKSSQLLLANVLCQVASNIDQLHDLLNAQITEIKNLTINCAYTGFTEKFKVIKH